MFESHGMVGLVEDDDAHAALLRQWLEADGYHVLRYHDEESCLEPMRANAFELMILNLNLPSARGMSVLHAVRHAEEPDQLPPILIMANDESPGLWHRAMMLGASDVLQSPPRRAELLLRTRTHLHRSRRARQLARERMTLNTQLTDKTRQLERAHEETLERLTRAAEYRDVATGRHARRVGAMAGAVARAYGLDDDSATLVERAAPLHDIGKIGIPDSILHKPGRHNDLERDIMAEHTVIGHRILGGSAVPLLAVAADIALTHHERWDGRGRLGLAGKAIPLAGRIVCVADVFDALTSERAYKSAWSMPAALNELQREAGVQFDPEVVAALLAVTRDAKVRARLERVG